MIGPSCKDIAHLVSKSQDQRLGFGQRFAIRMHLLFCVYCRRYARQLRWLEQAFGRVREDASAARLDDAARERIRDKLQDKDKDGN